MHFKKLELVGFKSFMDKTTLHFEPGVTAVVGPNGCGKSNIFDAIRWVLGEQSVKSLRGANMEDVIFNGTDLKQPLGMAEVSLTFDNDNKFFSLDHNEVTITRRIFRSGESEYLINRAIVRLKDILDLLMGTGIGTESYSIVAQGKIDLILSSRPEDRRMVFDEASGITKYKSQKREALRRLEDTEQNLLRVNDIITEVKRSIGHLERQANKARKYKELFEDLKNKETVMSVLERDIVTKEKTELGNQAESLKSQELGLQEIIKEDELKLNRFNDELKAWEDNIAAVKNEVINLENLVLRNKQHIGFNQKRVAELEESNESSAAQMEQTQARLLQDEERLNALKSEHAAMKSGLDDKSHALKEKELFLEGLVESIRVSLENIAQSKKNILEIANQLMHTKNAIVDLNSKQHVYAARKKRLDLEKAKVYEEKIQIEDSLKGVVSELAQIQVALDEFNSKVASLNNELSCETLNLNQIISELAALEKQKMSLESQKEFLEKLKTQYEGIDTSMNAVVYLDKFPTQKLSGLILKVKEMEEASLKISGEAKPIDLDTEAVCEKIRRIEESIVTLNESKVLKEARIQELNSMLSELQKSKQQQEIFFANKQSAHQNILEQFNKVKEEEDITVLELSDVEKELIGLEENIKNLQNDSLLLDTKQKNEENLIRTDEEKINSSGQLKEETLIIMAQIKTELDTLKQRLDSEESTLKMLEDGYNQDKTNLDNLKKQIEDSIKRQEELKLEVAQLEAKILQNQSGLAAKANVLEEAQEKCELIAKNTDEVSEKTQNDKKELDSLKEKVYDLQMKAKDIEYHYQTIKDRMLQGYKIDLDTYQPENPLGDVDRNLLGQEIDTLKNKLESLGSANMLAIEEYDELKKRYDFLTQQHTDLTTSKDSLQEAIRKINRTTKAMFLETFEKVQVEFRNHFRLLFNGGDAQVFLIDEQDPLESGIEIICRPPGKKLQNVLLLSGGEKTMSAIALIFAIFKVKPAPFCILDEIDAALDEANVDRFGGLLQEFARVSQFIVVTHNKKTIANADVMYGITMEESGVSKIVSVKFGSSHKPAEEVTEPVTA